MNYVDATVAGKRGCAESLTNKCKSWINDNIIDVCHEMGAELRYIGTGALTDDKIIY
jgi:hypothetical protein